MSNKFNGFTVDEIHKINTKSEHGKKMIQCLCSLSHSISLRACVALFI